MLGGPKAPKEYLQLLLQERSTLTEAQERKLAGFEEKEKLVRRASGARLIPACLLPPCAQKDMGKVGRKFASCQSVFVPIYLHIGE